MILLGFPMSLTTIILAVSILLLAGFVKGTLGFGVGLVSATLLFQLFPAKLVLVVLVLPVGLAEAGLPVSTGIPWELVREHATFFSPPCSRSRCWRCWTDCRSSHRALSGIEPYIVVFLAVQRRGSRAFRYKPYPTSSLQLSTELSLDEAVVPRRPPSDRRRQACRER